MIEASASNFGLKPDILHNTCSALQTDKGTHCPEMLIRLVSRCVKLPLWQFVCTRAKRQIGVSIQAGGDTYKSSKFVLVLTRGFAITISARKCRVILGQSQKEKRRADCQVVSSGLELYPLARRNWS